MNYEDFRVIYEFPFTVGGRLQKRCIITDGESEYEVVCGIDEDPIIGYLEANQ
ncbi:hypothetical protein [Acinetobacter sp. Ac_5812]|uniref:hypothetical protein n=1 Tax=Acinetobacter sp. Ac_5812 TaxID=1848937 RepID=UPI00148FBB1B|nr:hypothetical protein [Acinetobacter sp. Ac_5812]